MFEDVVVVQSAVSAFNNAALYGPAFLWWGVLALPLFVIAFMFGKDLSGRIGWNDNNLLKHVSVWTALLIFVWCLLFSGNYHVLRDDVSVLPFVNGVIVFLSSMFVMSHWRDRICKIKKWQLLLAVAVILLASVGMTVPVWWWPLIPVVALLMGGLLGRYSRGEMRPMAGIVLIGLVVGCAILMQPEFYRFGQLGNLTYLHLGMLLLCGIVGAAVVALANIQPGGKIGRTVYIKLKWLLRVFGVLSAALFLLTEAVPVFVGALLVIFVLLVLSIRYSDKTSAGLLDKMFAVFLMLLGVLTVMPVITVLGILYWVNTPSVEFWRNFRRLL